RDAAAHRRAGPSHRRANAFSQSAPALMDTIVFRDQQGPWIHNKPMFPQPGYLYLREQQVRVHIGAGGDHAKRLIEDRRCRQLAKNMRLPRLAYNSMTRVWSTYSHGHGGLRLSVQKVRDLPV